MKTCPVCGAKALVHDTRDIAYTYKGESTVIEAVTGDFCDACGESITGMAETERVMQAMRTFSQEVNARLVDPAYVLAVRQRLNLSQREASDLFGGGINAFSRYENGKAQPSVALVKLLRILDRHPELLPEVRAS